MGYKWAQQQSAEQGTYLNFNFTVSTGKISTGDCVETGENGFREEPKFSWDDIFEDLYDSNNPEVEEDEDPHDN